MKNKLHAVGYHGTNKKFVKNILGGIDFSRNKGDKFLGQGFYLWRDSYERAYKWAKRDCVEDEISVICAKINSCKENCFNFTSYVWNNEKEYFDIYLKDFNHLTFGEFIDLLIEESNLEINLIMIADLKDKPKTVCIEDEDNKTNFAHVDIQICLKNKKAIENLVEV